MPPVPSYLTTPARSGCFIAIVFVCHHRILDFSTHCVQSNDLIKAHSALRVPPQIFGAVAVRAHCFARPQRCHIEHGQEGVASQLNVLYKQSVEAYAVFCVNEWNDGMCYKGFTVTPQPLCDKVWICGYRAPVQLGSVKTSEESERGGECKNSWRSRRQIAPQFISAGTCQKR
ncbi:hypothetical protein J6590_011275 [Homalodisca vitripennis]|nr:hypothetical protein J6590_011275 [Homalodisca vitripennis]